LCGITDNSAEDGLVSIGNREHKESFRIQGTVLQKHRSSKNDQGIKTIGDLNSNFSVPKKCGGKLDCLIYEVLFIKKKKPKLNTQSDSIRAKLFI